MGEFLKGPAVLLSAAALLSVAAAPASAQSGKTYFITYAPVQVQEGDAGTKVVEVRWQLEGDTSHEISFDVSTAAEPATPSYYDVADAGIDFDPIATTRVVVPAGQTSGTMTLRVKGDLDVEQTQRATIHYRNLVGAVAPGQYGDVDFASSGVDIVNDDEPPAMPDIAAFDDHATVRWRGGPQPHSGIDPFANDVGPSHIAVTTSIVEHPQHGTAVPGEPDMVSQSHIAYVPDEGYVGPDHLRYRICAGSYCDEADVDIDVVRIAGWNGELGQRAGRIDVDEIAPMAMPSIRLLASPLVAPVDVPFQTSTDPTPSDPFDGPEGTHFQRFEFPALSADHADWYVGGTLANSVYDGYNRIDVYVGVDRDGDGAPSDDEVLCVSAMREPLCYAPVRQEPGVDAWWVMAHSRIPETIRRVAKAWELPVVDGDGSFVATGPGHVEAGEMLPLTLSWDDDSIGRADWRFGVVRVFAEDGVVVGDLAFGMRSYSPSLAPTMLLPESPRTFALGKDEQLRTLFFDVPAGASEVRIAATSGHAVEYRLWKQPDGPVISWDPTHPTPGSAPEDPAVPAYASGAGDDAAIVLAGAGLTPGRWFLHVRNASGTETETTVGLAIDGDAPVVRPGSYFDAERKGSGVFFYPAGGDWAGLWYTYRPDGYSTWYYLQGAAPGANGLWNGGIYRAAWDGDSRTLTRVGTASVAPTAADAFQFTYTIDGETGTRPHAALGRGCPAGDDGPVDISTHWFDPAHDGTGYSVQTWEDYEYFAAFLYDHQGRPTFLAAERDTFGGDDAVAALQVMKNVCPTCADPYGGIGPFRYDAGEMRRTLQDGALATIEIDAIWEVDFGGESHWSSVHRVQALGGPGSTQGCAP